MNPRSAAPKSIVTVLAVSTAVLCTIVFWRLPPLPQPPDYHEFADRRTLLGIANFWNVVSNLPFIVVAVAGMRFVSRDATGRTLALRPLWMMFFFAMMLTAFGSAYYHLQPDNESLVWDRLAMTLGFMCLVGIVAAEYLDLALGRYLLPILLLVGAASVLYWSYTESLGRGDLRPYVLVQFLPLLLIPVIVIVHASHSDLGPYLLLALAAYAVAKLFEHFDAELFDLFGGISGHTLKHLAAALPAWFLLRALRRRRGT